MRLFVQYSLCDFLLGARHAEHEKYGIPKLLCVPLDSRRTQRNQADGAGQGLQFCGLHHVASG